MASTEIADLCERSTFMGYADPASDTEAYSHDHPCWLKAVFKLPKCVEAHAPPPISFVGNAVD